jgi:nitrogen fixation protein NifQ
MSENLTTISYDWLMALAKNQEDDLARVFASVIQAVSKGNIKPPNLGMGLPLNKFIELLDTYFPGSSHEICGEHFQEAYTGHQSPLESEFIDMVGLFLEHRNFDAEYNVWLAYAIASGCMGSDHLYHDMGLPDRRTLSGLLERYFTTLFQKNVNNMKWKKFFYKQLCDRAEVMMCPARNCQSCADYKNCFSPEEAVAALVQEEEAIS